MENRSDDEFIADVIKRSLGVAPELIPEELYQVGFEIPRWHLIMLQDRPRLDYYSEIIKSKVKDQVVLDLGTGSGILSFLSLKWGAKKVYSVEQNPALQAAYRHLMRDYIANGTAELISDDAKFLRLDQFSEAPTIIVHELFGYLGMGENIVPILRALTTEGILTDKTQLVPDAFEVWVRPAYSAQLARESVIQDFEGYPLSELNIFGSQELWQEEFQAARDSKWEIKGPAQLMLKCDLRDLSLPESVVVSFEPSDCSHLKLWLKVIDKKSGLTFSNDHLEFESHWANACLTVPYWLKGKSFKVEFSIRPDKIEVARFF